MREVATKQVVTHPRSFLSPPRHAGDLGKRRNGRRTWDHPGAPASADSSSGAVRVGIWGNQEIVHRKCGIPVLLMLSLIFPEISVSICLGFRFFIPWGSAILLRCGGARRHRSQGHHRAPKFADYLWLMDYKVADSLPPGPRNKIVRTLEKSFKNVLSGPLCFSILE